MFATVEDLTWRQLATLLVGGAALLLATPAAADVQAGGYEPASFRIRLLASSQDGNNQIVELEEVAGQDGQHHFEGLTLSVADRFGVTKVFVFPTDLPSARTSHRHVILSQERLSGSFYLHNFQPDFILPSRFLPTDGGTIEFVDIDRPFVAIDSWTYDTIPTDGRVLLRRGDVAQDWVTNFSGEEYPCCGAVFLAFGPVFGIDLTGVRLYEYYLESLDHYFITGSQPDLDALDAGRYPGWQRSSPYGVFWASSSAASFDYTVPVCRYYVPPGSHFFSASADECDAVAQQHPEYVLESRAAFYAALPDLATGKCPEVNCCGPVIEAFLPVYRVRNNRPDTNYRFTASLDTRAEMIEKGWVSDGYGPMGVAMCTGDWE